MIEICNAGVNEGFQDRSEQYEDVEMLCLLRPRSPSSPRGGDPTQDSLRPLGRGTIEHGSSLTQYTGTHNMVELVRELSLDSIELQRPFIIDRRHNGISTESERHRRAKWELSS